MHAFEIWLQQKYHNLNVAIARVTPPLLGVFAAKCGYRLVRKHETAERPRSISRMCQSKLPDLVNFGGTPQFPTGRFIR